MKLVLGIGKGRLQPAGEVDQWQLSTLLSAMFNQYSPVMSNLEVQSYRWIPSCALVGVAIWFPFYYSFSADTFCFGLKYLNNKNCMFVIDEQKYECCIVCVSCRILWYLCQWKDITLDYCIASALKPFWDQFCFTWWNENHSFELRKEMKATK